MQSTLRAALLVAVAVPLAACGKTEEAEPGPLPPPISLGPPPAPHAPARQAPAPVPAPVPSESPAFPAPEPPKGIAKERFAPPAEWQAEKPASSMRLLQYRLPRAEGDGRDGEVAVFGSAMGGVKENLARWRGQFHEVAQGKDTVEDVAAGEGRTVHLLDVTGKYAATMPGQAPAEPAAPVETRMIAAIVEIPAGTYYVKALGPPATVTKWEKAIRDFVFDSAKK
jgi:hypothetical protein